MPPTAGAALPLKDAHPSYACVAQYRNKMRLPIRTQTYPHPHTHARTPLNVACRSIAGWSRAPATSRSRRMALSSSTRWWVDGCMRPSVPLFPSLLETIFGFLNDGTLLRLLDSHWCPFMFAANSTPDGGVDCEGSDRTGGCSPSTLNSRAVCAHSPSTARLTVSVSCKHTRPRHHMAHPRTRTPALVVLCRMT